MNSVNFKIVKNFTKNFTRGFLFAFFFFVQVKVHAEVITSAADVTAPTTETKVIAPTSAVIVKPSEMSDKQKNQELLTAIRKAVQPVEPTKEIVILNTEAGFIPEKVRVKKGEAYKVHVVNLNMRDKNVSFLMDSFTQSHNTVFGIKKSFNIEPQVEGIYSYQCPETGIQGQLIVVKDSPKRKLASEEEE
ncbi:MAG: cupredoxin domain-containing protein [Pseudobdellovibrio sp.]